MLLSKVANEGARIVELFILLVKLRSFSLTLIYFMLGLHLLSILIDLEVIRLISEEVIVKGFEISFDWSLIIKVFDH